MSIKISQFSNITSVADTNLLPIVEETSPSVFNSFKVGASTLKTYFLQGNADTATNLASSTTTLASTVLYSSLTSVGTLLDLTVTNTIGGSIDGNAETVTDGVYTTDTGTVTNTMLAGSIENEKLVNSSITINGVLFNLGDDSTITTAVAPATITTIGGVIVGGDLTVQEDGTLAVDTTTIATKTYVDNTSTDNAISFSVALG